MSRKVAVLLVALLLLPTSVSIQADTCGFECLSYTYEGCSMQIYVCHPEYDVWQYTEPDWCLYEHGSQVSLEYTNGQITAWYVHSANSPMTPQPWNYVVNDSSGCYLLIIFP